MYGGDFEARVCLAEGGSWSPPSRAPPGHGHEPVSASRVSASRRSLGARSRLHPSDYRTREADLAPEAQPTDVLCGAVASDSQASVQPTDRTIVAQFRLAEYNTVTMLVEITGPGDKTVDTIQIPTGQLDAKRP